MSLPWYMKCLDSAYLCRIRQKLEQELMSSESFPGSTDARVSEQGLESADQSKLSTWIGCVWELILINRKENVSMWFGYS